MKRRIFKLCAFLFLGAIINVAVAWGCAALVPASTASQALRSAVSIRSWKQSGTEYRDVRRFDAFGRTWIVCTHFRSHLSPDDDVWAKFEWLCQGSRGITDDVGIDTLLPNWTGFEADHGIRIIASSGWPRQCLWSERQATVDSPKGGLDVGLAPWSTWQFRDLPAWPIWPGFAINTIFYAAILWLPFAGFRFVRRRIRARRGQCPTCAYPIGTSDVCTECGAAVRPK